MGFIELPALAMEGSDARTRLSMLITALRQIVMLLLAFCAAWVVLFEASSRQAVHMGTDDRCVLGGPTPAPTPMLAAVTSPSGEAITSQPCG